MVKKKEKKRERPEEHDNEGMHSLSLRKSPPLCNSEWFLQVTKWGIAQTVIAVGNDCEIPAHRHRFRKEERLKPLNW